MQYIKSAVVFATSVAASPMSYDFYLKAQTIYPSHKLKDFYIDNSLSINALQGVISREDGFPTDHFDLVHDGKAFADGSKLLSDYQSIKRGDKMHVINRVSFFRSEL